MRKAVIDLGTNTFNLLIAEVGEDDFSVLHTEKEGVALGMGGINKRMIADQAWERAITTLKRYKQVCEDFQVKEIKAIGTSALREAENKAEFIAEVLKETGIRIEVISGLKEAELIYKGVRWSYSFKYAAVIMDIGGGSTEFVFANRTGITDMVSLNIGVSRIFQLFQFSDPLSKQDIQTIIDWLEEKADGYFDNKREQVLIGASGTFETFYEMVHNEPFPESIKAVELSLDYLLEILDEIIASTQEERDQNDWIIPIRKKMAPIAAVKVKWILEKLHVKRVYISPCSLKEGALAGPELVPVDE